MARQEAERAIRACFPADRAEAILRALELPTGPSGAEKALEQIARMIAQHPAEVATFAIGGALSSFLLPLATRGRRR